MAQQEYTILKALAKVRDSGDYSDLTIICGPAEFKVHRAVVCSQSGFFKMACKKGFTEGNSGVVELQEEDEKLVQVMIDYLYTNTLTIEIPTDIRPEKAQKCDHENSEHSCMEQACYLWPCGFAIAMYAMGDKYDIPGLRVSARDYLQTAYNCCGTDSWADDIKIFEFAYQQSSRSDDLRCWLTTQICHSFALFQGFNGRLHEHPGFYPFIERSPELALPLLRHALLDHSA